MHGLLALCILITESAFVESDAGQNQIPLGIDQNESVKCSSATLCLGGTTEPRAHSDWRVNRAGSTGLAFHSRDSHAALASSFSPTLKAVVAHRENLKDFAVVVINVTLEFKRILADTHLLHLQAHCMDGDGEAGKLLGRGAWRNVKAPDVSWLEAAFNASIDGALATLAATVGASILKKETTLGVSLLAETLSLRSHMLGLVDTSSRTPEFCMENKRLDFLGDRHVECQLSRFEGVLLQLFSASPVRTVFNCALGLSHAVVIGSLLRRKAAKLKTGMLRIAEVGVSEGDFGRFILDTVPNLRYFGVDPHSAVQYHGSSWGTHGDMWHLTALKTLLPHSRRATLFRMTSLEGASVIQDGTLDCVFLDGDHSYKGVTEDLYAWFPKLRRGGIIAGHDFSLATADQVVAAVHEFFEKYPAADGTLHLAPDQTFFWQVP